MGIVLDKMKNIQKRKGAEPKRPFYGFFWDSPFFVTLSATL